MPILEVGRGLCYRHPAMGMTLPIPTIGAWRLGFRKKTILIGGR